MGNFPTPVPIAKDSGDESVVQRLSIIALNILEEMSYLRHLSQQKSLKKKTRQAIQEEKHIFSKKKKKVTFPLSKMTPGNQCNLAGELSNSNKGINLCFKIYQKLQVKSERLLGVEQFPQYFVIVKKGKPEMRIDEIPPQDIIYMTIIFSLLKTYFWEFFKEYQGVHS